MKKRYLIAGIFTGLILQLTHHIWLGSHGDKHFDLMVMLIILICGFLLGLKLTSYLADFKNIKEKSRIEIVFLAVFFLFLVIPVLNINQSEKSVRENRMLATYQPLIQKDRINIKYGKDFENYFNDRFYLRDSLINNYHFFRAILSVHYYETDSVFYIKNVHGVFLKGHIPKDSSFKKETVNKSINSLDMLNSFCQKNNIKLYVLIVPYNQHIYQKLTVPFDNPEGLQILNNNVNTLISETNANVIFPFDELKEGSKKDWVYFKTDHHWTDTGAFIGYNCLIKEILKDFPNVKQVKQSDFIFKCKKSVRADFYRDFYMGHQLNNAGSFLKPLKNSILDTKYKYFYHKNIKLLKEDFIDNEYKKSRETYYPMGADYKVLELGTSMNENLLQFVSYTFKNVRYLRLNPVKNRKSSETFKIMKYYKKEILNYKPDIMIFCVTVNNLKELNHIFDEE